MRTFDKNINDDDIIKKWEEYGLLVGVVNKRILSHSLECSIELISGINSGISQHNGLIIPIVCRIIRRIDPKTKSESRRIIKKIIQSFPIFLQNNSEIINQLRGFNQIDVEYEVCSLFEDYFVRNYERYRRN